MDIDIDVFENCCNPEIAMLIVKMRMHNLNLLWNLNHIDPQSCPKDDITRPWLGSMILDGI